MQKGRSMVEMLGILVIIAVVTMGSIALWSQMRIKMRITQMQNELSQISQDIAKLYSWTRDYSLLKMSQLCPPCPNDSTKYCSDVFPKGCENGLGINPFGGTYTAIGDNDGTPLKDEYGVPYFILTATGLPDEDVCHEIMDVLQEDYECNGNTLTVTFY